MEVTVIPFGSAFVVGALPSGLYAALYLKSRGIRVFVSESKEICADARLSASASMLDKAGIPCEFGQNSEATMAEYDVVVVSPGVPPDASILRAARKAGKAVVGETEIASYAGLSVLGVTGSNGKSTTTAMLGEMISRAFPQAVTGGNLGPPVSQLLVEHPQTDVAVLEVSCFQLETIRSFHPRVGVFTNIVPNHLDRYGTMEAYVQTKMRLFENMRPDDYAVLNWDDPTLRRAGDDLVPAVYYFGLVPGTYRGAYVAGDSVLYRDGHTTERLFDRSDVRIPGQHNLVNAMSAALAAYLYGVVPTDIQKALCNFEGLSHRLEYVGSWRNIVFVNDSKATTPESVMTASAAMAGPYVVILGGSSKGISFDRMAQCLAQDTNLVAAVVLGTTGPAIAESIRSSGRTPVVYAGSLEDAVLKGVQLLPSGGTLLLSPACASFDMFRDFEERGDRFKEIVHTLAHQPAT